MKKNGLIYIFAIYIIGVLATCVLMNIYNNFPLAIIIGCLIVCVLFAALITINMKKETDSELPFTDPPLTTPTDEELGYAT